MKMFVEISLIAIVVLLLIYISLYYVQFLFAPSAEQNKIGSVCIKDNCFSVEVAETSAQKERGLMYRNELEKNKGMLFVFNKEGIYPFWMKNTLIQLDIIWIDSNSKVVFINPETQPCKSFICPNVVPQAKAKYVLELNGGLTDETGLKVGDILKISY